MADVAAPESSKGSYQECSDGDRGYTRRLPGRDT
jgi:hypothetical protein